MENGCGGRSLSLSFQMESTTGGSRIPRLAEFARIKTNSSGLITPKAGWSIYIKRPGPNGAGHREMQERRKELLAELKGIGKPGHFGNRIRDMKKNGELKLLLGSQPESEREGIKLALKIAAKPSTWTAKKIQKNLARSQN
jgi:hypothetical protein